MPDFVDKSLQEVEGDRLSAPAAADRVTQVQKDSEKAPPHVLVQRDTSISDEHCYSSRLTGGEFFLRDHVVAGQHVLPAAAQLEMARAAVDRVLGRLGEGAEPTLENVVFSRPVVVGEGGLELHITLVAGKGGAVDWKIHSDRRGADDGEASQGEPGRVAHTHGRAVLSGDEARRPPPVLNLWDFPTAGAAMPPSAYPDPASANHASAQLYRLFDSMGLSYGPSFRVLCSVQSNYGADGQACALGELRLPSDLYPTRNDYVLHPSLLDGALQAGVGLESPGEDVLRNPVPPGLILPFALDRLEIFAPTPESAWAVVRSRPQVAEGIQTLDIQLSDAEGRVCVRLTGLSCRRLAQGANLDLMGDGPAPAVVGDLTLAVVDQAMAPPKGDVWPAAGDVLILAGTGEDELRHLRELYPNPLLLELDDVLDIGQIASRLQQLSALANDRPIDHLLWSLPPSPSAGPGDATLVEAQGRGVLAGFRLIKALLALGYGGRSLGLTVITRGAVGLNSNDRVHPAHASVHGLVGSLAKEYPRWRVRLVDLPDEEGGPGVDVQPPLQELFALPSQPQGDAVLYRFGQWRRAQLVPCELPAVLESRFRRGGVYLIVGGAGGLGEALSEHLIREHRAQVVWIGRRAPDETIAAKQERLAALGPRPLYIAADARDRDALEAACDEILLRFGALHGVVASTIVLQDHSLASMDSSVFRASLSAKVDVSVNLAAVFGSLPLDVVLFFSSAQSFSKLPGQSNYAAGCTFTDAHAQAWHGLSAFPVKVVNWGYWGDLGVVATAEHRARMAQAGVGSVRAGPAMQLVERLLAAPKQRVAFVAVTKTSMSQALGVAQDERLVVAPASPVVLGDLDLERCVHGLSEPAQPLWSAIKSQAVELEAILARMLWGQLGALGLMTATGAVEVSRLTIAPGYERWLQHSLDVLQQANYLRGAAGLLYAGQPVPPLAQLWGEWDAYRTDVERDQPWEKAHLSLIDGCLRALPEILQGRKPATEVLFPKGSMELLEGMYAGHPVVDHFNEVLTQSLLAYVRRRLELEPAARLRLLEIGAGTGGTSARLFQALAPYADRIDAYCFSDISKAFLLRGEERFQHVPYLKTQLFDVETSPGTQGFQRGGYDLVIATNVLHATRDVRGAVQNAKALLKQGGVLLLNELTATGLSTHLTVGLLAGWWLPQDLGLRLPGSPALAPSTWRGLLMAEGFGPVMQPRPEDHALGQQVVLAESDGWSRLRNAEAAPSAPAASPSGPSGAAARVLSDFTMRELKGRVEAALAVIASRQLKMRTEDVDPKAPLKEFGFDSITLTAFAEALNETYGLQLLPTVFFEYTTLNEVAGHLASEHASALARHFKMNVEPPAAAAGLAPAIAQSAAPRPTPPGERHASDQPAGDDVGPEPIAIIGMSGRFPHACDIDELWRNLLQERDCVGRLPRERWGLYGDVLCDQPAGVLEEADKFDPLFFGISPREAEAMDPHQRLLMMTVWAALEDAGYAPHSLAGSDTALLVGVGSSGYAEGFMAAGASIEGHSVAGAIASLGPNRMSYFLDLNGPSEPVETACSSSLVAIHRAVQLLQAGQCGLAIAGGVNVLASPGAHISLSKAGMLSPDGRCKTFSAEADGYVRGEGVGMLLLKPLSAAERDGDHIYALIRGSAQNHGGRANSLTAPNPRAHAELIKAALRRARVSPQTVSYIEAHGTGTPLGDPVEIQGLKSAFKELAQELGEPEPPANSCALGTVKSNIGHLEFAAGVAGVIKTVLQLQSRTIVRSLHSQELNPLLELQGSPFYVARETAFWPEVKDAAGRPQPRRAGISSFSFGGTNAHVIVEEYVVPDSARVEAAEQGAPAVIVLSARSAAQLRAQAQQLVAAVEAEAGPAPRLADVAYTLQVGREAMEWRLACVVENLAQLRGRLRAWLDGEGAAELHEGQARQYKDVLGLFSGDEELRQAVEAWAAKGKLERLAQLWARGLSVDWGLLRSHGPPPRRIRLPTYPFLKERYWFDATGGQAAAAEQVEGEGEGEGDVLPPAPVRAEAEAPRLMLFEERWQVRALEAAAGAPLRTLVCFLTEPGRREAFARSLCELSPDIKVVFVGLAGAQALTGAGGEVYEVGLGDRAGLAGVLGEIGRRHGPVDGLLYLWPLEQAELVESPTAWIEIVQALAQSALSRQHLVLAGRAVDEEAQAHLESWIGAERSIGLMLPQPRLAVIIEAALGSEVAPDLGAWAQRLHGELRAGAARSALYRAGARHVCVAEDLVLDDVTPQPALRSGGTYLITGGCGGLGFLFAKRLAAAYGANLVLTGRSAPEGRISQQIGELEALGARVVYGRADVSDEAAMRAVLEDARRRFGAIQGVIHAAGLAAENMSIAEKPMAAFERTLAPKVQGTLVLDRLLRDQPLDFFCCFSSSSAVLGDFGGCDYAMANRFLLAYAQARSRRVLRGEAAGKTLAIAWPLWEAGGMGFATEAQTELYLKSSGQQALCAAEGLDLFERLLRGTATQPLVMVGEPARLRRMLARGEAAAGVAGEQRSPARQGEGWRPELKGYTLAQCVEWDLKQQISALLGLRPEQLDPDANLADFGFDSIQLTEFARRLSDRYGIELTPTVFFSHPNLGRLVRHFATAFRPQLEDFYREVGGSEARPRTRASKPTSAARGPAARPAAPSAAFVREPIAVIGMSGRFPGARTVQEFWELLREGRSAVREIPIERFDWREHYGDPLREPGKTNGKWLGVLDGVEEFDPLFFEISPREARVIDPRQRLLLQEAWRALEDACYGREQLETHKLGMFVGVEQGDYQYLLAAATGDLGGVTANHDGVLASRLAYLLDLQGPVVAINTACSSGLVAAHQACLSLWSGECDTAIAAGVNLLLTHQAFVGMAQAGMLSDDGKCHAFGHDANGMVPGEAVVAVVLKRLSQAEEEGDPILAVIRGSGANYDGKTNGITAPSGAAQARLLKEVYRQHRIDARALSYVVGHGTGTPLGDPIEVQALCEAFGEQTAEQGFCALTSTKANVGHTFAASGLVSLVALVQALRHETIPPSLHCERESDYVRWRESPFYVNREARPWPRRAEPRLGAISAFGMSGTNAHMVLSNWEDEAAPPDPLPHHLLVLSAKTPEALAERIEDMARFLESRDWRAEDLHAISHTLFVGRQHFAHRCAIVAENAPEAVRLWRQASSGQILPNLWRGQVPRGFTPQRMLLEYAERLLEQTPGLIDDPAQCREHLQFLGELYCQGYEVPWPALFGPNPPRRVHLPTYPFARERYWVEPSDVVAPDRGAGMDAAAKGAAVLHPLVHRNTSDLKGLRYSTRLSGEEFFLHDTAAGRRILPATAQLELAREAVRRALGGETQPELHDVAFAEPAAAEPSGLQLHLALQVAPDGVVEWEIYSTPCRPGEADADEDETVLHSQGRAVARDASSSAPPPLEIAALRAREEVAAPPAVHQQFEGAGLREGGSAPVLRELWSFVGPDQRPEVLAALQLPPDAASTAEDYVLHPAILEGALQSCAALEPRRTAEALSPARGIASLERLEVFAPMSPQGWARVRRAGQPGRLEIVIADKTGRICARLGGLSLRSEEEPEVDAVAIRTLLMRSHWAEQSESEAESADLVSVAQGGHWVVLCDVGDEAEAAIRAELPHAKPVRLGEASQASVLGLAELAARYTAQAEGLLALVREILNSKPRQPVLVQLVTPSRGPGAALRGLLGLLKSAQQENPRLLWQRLEVEEGVEAAELARWIRRAAAAPKTEVRYLKDGVRQQLRLEEVTPVQAQGNLWKAGGTYLVTGGAGKLGLLFARAIAEQATGVKLVLTGRSAESAAVRAVLRQLKRLGAEARYAPTDVADRRQMDALVAQIVEDHGRLDGVIHSAGLLRDGFVLTKDAEGLREVFAPKVSGIVNLDLATRGLDLDCFVVFSSTAALFGNVGQADYAAANGFMDGYVAWREAQVAAGLAYGRTLSIVWPLWADGGMQVDGLVRERMWREAGLAALSSEAGLAALDQALALPHAQVTVLSGSIERMQQTVLRPVFGEDPPASAAAAETTSVDPKLLMEKTTQRLARLLSELNELPLARIDIDEPLEAYGLNSIMVGRLNLSLEGVFEGLPKTLFFEHRTLRTLGEHLASDDPTACAKWCGLEKTARAVGSPMEDEPRRAAGPPARSGIAHAAPSLRGGRRRLPGSQPVVAVEGGLILQAADPIAIIGLSGRYAMADTLEDYWRNLAEGVDCITEASSERWERAKLFAEGGKGTLWGGFIEGFSEFDPLFFNISPRQARTMDPQERLFLQCAYEVLQDAGYTRERLKRVHQGRVGVFAGITTTGFELYGPQQWTPGAQDFPHTSFSSVANRVSYCFDFNGPSLPVDTMCSSSLTALHEARIHLLRGECELALAGGVNLFVHPSSYMARSAIGMLSSDGRCKSFGEGGDGYVPGEGVGAVLLKPLSRAVEDGDRIYGVIRGSAINHGGRTHGYTVPNPKAQAEVIARALKESGVHPRAISYVEAHGTGTALGDPIEIAGLSEAYGAETSERQYCAIGSAKSNIGHCESAAGIAGLTKVLLQMQHRTLVKSLHSGRLNPNIAFERTPFVVQQTNAPWERPCLDLGTGEREYPRIAGVSSFGAGGANAHVVVEEYVDPESAGEEADQGESAVIVPSAHGEAQ